MFTIEQVTLIVNVLKIAAVLIPIAVLAYKVWRGRAKLKEFPGSLPMEETTFTHGYNQKIFKNLRELVNMACIDLLDDELQILELKNLQIKRSGDSWSVKAPDSGLCTTDDVADALANCVYLCMLHKKGPGDFIFI